MSDRIAEMSLWDLSNELIDQAECLSLPELHDGPNNPASETIEDRAAREEVARQVCAECPVRALCDEYAFRTLPKRGIWAGYHADEITEMAARNLGEVA
ncbi:WhiB family transcriptional regulator [Spirillospora sp. NPDC048911]|uniref:WhiB family transcriptional regulator n=1 Tax=Spirillospora sp. NPDC048911 TaxID=3364527 RepID=UPI0037180405